MNLELLVHFKVVNSTTVQDVFSLFIKKLKTVQFLNQDQRALPLPLASFPKQVKEDCEDCNALLCFFIYVVLFIILMFFICVIFSIFFNKIDIEMHSIIVINL